MRGRVEKKELVGLVAKQAHRDAETVAEVLEATIEEIYEALKRGEVGIPARLRHILRPP